jgi:hypothetical protein
MSTRQRKCVLVKGDKKSKQNDAEMYKYELNARNNLKVIMMYRRSN